jgi:general secretion pathway protein G
MSLKHFRSHKKNSGFTILEILVVVAIIAILTTLGMVSYTQVNKRARDGKRRADLEQVRSALVLYRVDNGSYPSSITWSTMSPIQSYISGTTVRDPQPSPYPQYEYTSSSGISFSVCATLEATTPSSYCLTNP